VGGWRRRAERQSLATTAVAEKRIVFGDEVEQMNVLAKLDCGDDSGESIARVVSYVNSKQKPR
jgi:hypothetical protein